MAKNKVMKDLLERWKEDKDFNKKARQKREQRKK